MVDNSTGGVIVPGAKSSPRGTNDEGNVELADH